ncbi:UDP-glucose/GDP-mannose dehydrogenase family protein [Patescibacteria group bacterium]|nr:UDP-glucose/GDP-mannose dehydrogenase family protein [Patescibacteria group bacterium]MBU1931238.1 UDP-glucose/GDP-mannose dehydrogenase family protein [Patescibacteria group bacterium]
MKIVVVGTGYVGLVTAAIMAKFNHQTVGLDIDALKIKKLNQGKPPFFEAGLEDLLQAGIKKKRLSFTTSYRSAITGAQVVFICVGTPSKDSGEIDLSYIKQACKSVARAMKGPLLLAIKSTVPPGIQTVIKPIIKQHTKYDFDLVTCPEFLREGSAVEDSLHPDRIIIGAENDKAASIILKLHQSIKAPKHVFDINSAQLVKYSANAFLANKISFANQIANLCDRVGADAKLVMFGLGLDRRIGKDFLNPGLGFGGSCFPKDNAAISFLAKQHGFSLIMVDTARNINEQQVDIVFNKLVKLLGPLKGKTVAVLGLAFKPGTDDMRQARSVPLIKNIVKAGARVRVYDPAAISNARRFLKSLKIIYSTSAYHAIETADAMVLVTEWPEFAKLNFKAIKRLMKQAIVVDGRNLFEPAKLKKLGFKYLGVGRR